MFQGLPFFKCEYKKIGFEDIQYATKYPQDYLIINTLSITEQECLIKSTLNYAAEEKLMNELIAQYKFKTCKLIVYGKNDTDGTAEKKCKQLIDLGFSDVYLYSGGMFEWLLLQDIYGKDEFPTTNKMLDILKFKPCRVLINGHVKTIGYG
jgi:hypothetical protein